MIILQKLISESGYCSRRKAEELIRTKQVLVNGQIAQPGMRANYNDEIKINHQIIKIQKKIYIKLHKPINYTCTNRKFKKEKNIFDLINIEDNLKKSLHIVGRLDKNSRGLVLITNDGDFTQKITHPKFGCSKHYIVQIFENLNQKNILEICQKFLTGIKNEDDILKAKSIKYLENKKFSIILTQGKKRQIRRMFRFFNLNILDLMRTSIASFQIEDLGEGKWKYLSKKELQILKD